MPDQRDSLMANPGEEGNSRHRIDQAFAELVGLAVVEARNRDATLGHLEAESRIEHRGAVESANRTADAECGASLFCRRMQDDWNRAASGRDRDFARARDFFTWLDAGDSQIDSFSHGSCGES